MKVLKQESHHYEIEHYHGSLDFSCYFCKSNSYNNIHLKKDGILKFVVCKDCFMKELSKDHCDIKRKLDLLFFCKNPIKWLKLFFGKGGNRG